MLRKKTSQTDVKKKVTSDTYRAGGAVISLKITLDRGEDLDRMLDGACEELKRRGFEVEEIHRGERPAFLWEEPGYVAPDAEV